MGADHDQQVPLTDTQRTVVIVVHYLAFVVGAWNIWAFLRRIDLLRDRIWAPFVLLLGLIWLQVGSALEIGNHFYEGDWELAGFPSDLVNGSFYFFNFGAQYLNALGLRKKGVPFVRYPAREDGTIGCLLDLTAMIFDFLMVIGVIITAPLYAVIGRDDAIGMISAFGAIAGVGTLFRLWRNLGPNTVTLLGGILFLTLALLGVGMTSVYRNTGIEWLHIFIGGSFVSSLVPFTVAILYAEEKSLTEEDPAAGDALIVKDSFDNDAKEQNSDKEEEKAEEGIKSNDA